MDPEVIGSLGDKLPNLSEIRSKYQYQRCASVFPPDSIPAWATFHTGQHPSRHGWLDNIDYKDIFRGTSAYDVKRLENNTFWDIAGSQGRRVCIINPFLAYPVWPVNGIMVNGPVFITGEVQAYPSSMQDKYSFPELGGMTEFPDQEDLEGFIQNTLNSTKELADFGIELLQSEDWDLYFISFFSLDRLQHFLWRYFDKEDPTYPGPNSLDTAIPDSYKLFDDIVGQYMEYVSKADNTKLLILSDHGHGRRPVRQFNLNELLRRNNFLKTPREKKLLAPKRWVEKTKNWILSWLAKNDLEDWTYKIAQLLPSSTRKTLKKSSFVINKDESLAWASEIGGGAAVGGIEINSSIKKMEEEKYWQICDQIKKVLAENSLDGDVPVVEWIKHSGDLAGDGFGGSYPDIVFELNEDYSVGRSLYTEVFGNNPRHLRVSGGHKPHGVCLLYGNGNIELPENISISDMYDLILTTIGCSL